MLGSIPRRLRLAWAVASGDVVALGIGTAAAILLALATPWGIGVTPDSVTYLEGALHLARGEGFVETGPEIGQKRPITHYPPAYPALLAGLAAIGGKSPLEAARWLAILLFAINVALAGRLALCFTRNQATAAFCAILMASSATMWEIHSAAWSEPLFIALGTVGLASLGVYLEDNRRLFLWLGALAIGLACLTRYAGLALLATGLVALLGWGPHRRQRLIDAALLTAIGSGPLALWLARNLQSAGSATNRIAHFQLAGFDDARAAFTTLASWLGPGSDRIQLFPAQDAVMMIALLLFLLTLAGASVWLHGSRGRHMASAPSNRRVPILFTLFIPVYASFLWASISFFDPGIPLDQRLLAPLFLPCLLSVVELGHRLTQTAQSRRLVLALGSAAVALSVVYFIAAGVIATHLFREGRGFTGQAWRYEKLAAYMATLDQEAVVFSDHPEAIRFLYARPARPLEKLRAADPAKPRQDVIVFFERARRFPPREAAARKQTSDREFRRLLENLESFKILSERNATVYLVPARSER